MQIIGTKGSIHMRKEFNSATGFVWHNNISIIPMFCLEHQYGCPDVTWKCSVGALRPDYWEKISVLTRPRPCGIPARKTEMAHYNQEDAPVRAQGQAMSQKDLSSFNGQPNTKGFCLFE